MNRSLVLPSFVSLTLALVLGSCASKPAAAVQAPPPAAGAVAKASAKVAKQRTVVIKVPVLVKETSFYSDGLVDGYIVYKIDDANKRLIEKATFDPSRADPVERLVPEYKDGRLAAESVYDSDAKLRSRRELGYDASGQLVSERVLDGNGKVAILLGLRLRRRRAARSNGGPSTARAPSRRSAAIPTTART